MKKRPDQSLLGERNTSDLNRPKKSATLVGNGEMKAKKRVFIVLFCFIFIYHDWQNFEWICTSIEPIIDKCFIISSDYNQFRLIIITNKKVFYYLGSFQTLIEEINTFLLGWWDFFLKVQFSRGWGREEGRWKLT